MKPAIEPTLMDLRGEIDQRLSELCNAALSDSAARRAQRELAQAIEEHDRLESVEQRRLEAILNDLRAATSTLLADHDRGTIERSVRQALARITDNARVALIPVENRETSALPGWTTFPIDIDHGPSIALLIEGSFDDVTREALDGFVDLIAVALESASLGHRQQQQDAVLAHLPPHCIGHLSRPTVPLGDPGELTAREREVMALVLNGLSNRAIADELFISTDTVKSHVKKILKKSGAANRAEFISRTAHSTGAGAARHPANRPSTAETMPRR
ncbi:helix-turn-helix transcriptional regulator [Gordonia sp. NPDC003424]